MKQVLSALTPWNQTRLTTYPPHYPSPKKGLLEPLFSFLAVITLLASIFTYWGKGVWVGELLSNGRHLLFLIALLLGLYGLFKGRWLIILMMVACLVMNGLAMLPFWGISVPGLNTTSRWEEPDFNAQPVTDTQHAPVEVTMMIANIYRLNTDYERVTQHVLEASADIVALVEVTKPAYFVLIKQPGIQKRFPHHYYSYSNCSLLLSKTPLLKAKEVDADGQYLNSILVQATTRIAGRDLALWVTHPPHSTDRLNFLKKRDFLDFFRGRPLPENLLLVGDLNMTPWSNHFQEFLDITQLKSASTGFGFQPTWPVKRDFPVVFPIDHAFYKGAVSIEDWHVEPSLGSDHLPVRFVFKLY